MTVLKYEDVSPTMRAFIGTWETLRRVGFSSADLYFMVAKSVKIGGRLAVFCVLKTQGKEFSIECGAATGEGDAEREYVLVSTAMAAGELEEGAHERMFLECEACVLKVHLLASLMAKGFTLPSRLPS